MAQTETITEEGVPTITPELDPTPTLLRIARATERIADFLDSLKVPVWLLKTTK